MVLVADFEGDGLLDSLTTLWTLGVFDIDANVYTEYSDHRPGAPSLEEGLAKLQAADLVAGHNFLGYDIFAVEKLYPKYALSVEKIRDTQVLSRLYDPSRKGGHSLDALGTSLFNAPKHPSPDFSRYSRDMSDYLKQDLRITVKLWRWLAKETADWGYSVELEHKFAYLMALQMRNGFCFDEPRARELLIELTGIKADLETKLKSVFQPWWVKDEEFTPKKDDANRGYVAGCPFTKVELEEFNPGSRQQIAKRLIKTYDWRPEMFTETGQPEISEESLAKTNFPETPLLLDYLRNDKMLGMLDGEVKKNGSGGGWLKHVKNGRIHGYVNSNGAVTGRCTHSKPNVSQADSDPRMRSLWIPRQGWRLVGADAEGIELRGLGHYLAPFDGGRLSEAVANGDKSKGTDAHSINRDIIGLFNRGGAGQVGAKNYIYALMYGAGDAKLGEIVIQDACDAGKYNPTDAPHLFKPNGKPRSKSDLGKESRAKIESGLTGLGQLVKKVKLASKKRGYLIGIDGRRLWTRSEHSALNTLLQGFGAIIMKESLVRFHWDKAPEVHTYGEGFAYCAHVHDEIQVEACPPIADDLGRAFTRAIEEAGVKFNVRCPLAGTYVVGASWAETH